MAVGAVLLDVDGTLVDSNYLHVEAWSRAFFDVGRPVDVWRVHRCIGMDGDQLLSTLLGEDIEGCGPRAQELHIEYYRQSAGGLGALPGARDLTCRVHSSGLRVVLATSAPEDEPALLRETLDIDEMIYAATSSASVDVAEPNPDLIEIALAEAGAVAVYDDARDLLDHLDGSVVSELLPDLAADPLQTSIPGVDQ